MRLRCLVTIALVVAGRPEAMSAQQWNDPRALALVRLATDRRAQQLADSGLVDYRATAHGYLAFLAQLGEGFREPPQVVKADELALQVYWKSPNRSKQRIVGRRDTTLLPTDIDYHRDHLGIVQNNFPAIIRLGDGDEVKDVPHPLSPIGLGLYDFAITDSLRIRSPGREIGVYEVKVRPLDDREPRVIGALYLDRDNGQVVRMALSFTRAAFKDKLLEDLFVVLENGLVGARFWLPRRQEIEIRRTSTWMDYPVRGIIRGRWEIREYELNVGLENSVFAGPEIVATPPAVQRSYPWPSTRILDSLPPDVRAITADEVKRVQAEVQTLVRAQALRRARGGGIAGRSVSDFLRYNRVEGVAAGAGLFWRAGGGVNLAGRARYGLEDREWKGGLDLGWQNAQGRAVRLFVSDDFRDVGDVPERSRVVNSIAAQEFGSDFTDPYRVRAAGASVSALGGGMRWTLEGSYEDHSPLATHAIPATGVFAPPPAVESQRVSRVRLQASRPTSLWKGFELRSDLAMRLTLGGPASPVMRFFGDVDLQRPLSSTRFLLRTLFGATFGDGVAGMPQDAIYFGGTTTGPGYPFHSLASDIAISQRLELQMPVPFPALSLGRFGRSASAATFAPFTTLVSVNGPGEWFYPSVGAGLQLFFDVVRFDVARGLRDGGRWTWSVDVSRAFWGIL
jgi:hypothetical protein